MEENNDILELKAQMAALQSRLDSVADMKDDMVRKALDSSIVRFRRLGNKSFYTCLFCLVFVMLVMYFQKVSVPLFVFTLLFLSVNLYLAYVSKEKYTSIDSSESLVETTRKVLEYKKFNRTTLLAMAPVAIIFLVWYVYDLGSSFGLVDFHDFIPLILSCLGGGVIGGVIGYFGFYRPSMEQADSIAEQISDLSK